MTVGSVVTNDAGAATRRATWADVRLLGWIVLTDLVFVGASWCPT